MPRLLDGPAGKPGRDVVPESPAQGFFLFEKGLIEENVHGLSV